MLINNAPPPLYPDHLAHPKYRPDIDGLRAIAILSVVGFHAFPSWIKGGFIGVDIFFVISGYLISTIIVGSLGRNSFSFAEFYIRRINRIFPALLLVLIACFAFGWFALLADEYKQLSKHIAGGAGFIANFLFWNESGYFDNAAETKPLLHLWSLGIEEQFYIIWPLLLWLAWKKKFNLLIITAAVAVISFALNIFNFRSDAIAAFYSPQTRFWELLTGSILAYMTLHKNNAPPPVREGCVAEQNSQARATTDANVKTLRNALSVFGAVLITIGFFVISKKSYFPGWWAVLPTIGTVLIISADTQSWINRVVLSNRVLVWLGLISFPFYLWHWPLLSFARIIEGETPVNEIRSLTVLMAIALAWLTYKFVEKPIRYSNINSKARASTLLILMIIVGYVGYYSYEQNGFEFRLKEYEQVNRAFKPIESANEKNNCLKSFSAFQGNCFLSTNTKNLNLTELVFLGDSHAQALSLPIFRINSALKILTLGKNGCLPFDGVDRFNENYAYKCDLVFDALFEKMQQGEFTNATLFLSARYSAYITGKGYGKIEKDPQNFGDLHIQNPGKRIDTNPVDYKTVFKNGLRNTLSKISVHVKKIVFIHQVPELGFDPKICVSRPFRNINHSCKIKKEDVLKRQSLYREAVNEVLVEFPNVAIFDPLDYLCDTEYCYASNKSSVFYRDWDHINDEGAKYLAQFLLEKFSSRPVS